MPTPEQEARILIDAKLAASGWTVQTYREMNLGAGPGLAVTEFPGAHGPSDYLLYVGQDLYRRQHCLPSDPLRPRAPRLLPGGPHQPRHSDQQGIPAVLGERQTFDKLYNLAFPRKNRFDPVNRVVITTIQRVYSVLTGQPDLAEEDEERSSFECPGPFQEAARPRALQRGVAAGVLRRHHRGRMPPAPTPSGSKSSSSCARSRARTISSK